MQLEVKKYLFDIEHAAAELTAFVAGRSRQDYLSDSFLRSAEERQFEIVGEATSKLAKIDSAVAQRITDHRKLIDFRNVLIHGYAEVDDEIVWDLIQTKLPTLLAQVRGLLAS